jgi:hypothetical protein
MRKHIKNIFILLTIIILGSYLTLQAKEKTKQASLDYNEIQSKQGR